MAMLNTKLWLLQRGLNSDSAQKRLEMVQRIRALTLDDAGIRAIVLAGFERLTAALRAGDGDAAAAATHAHLVEARRAFVTAVGLDKT